MEVELPSDEDSVGGSWHRNYGFGTRSDELDGALEARFPAPNGLIFCEIRGCALFDDLIGLLKSRGGIMSKS